MNIFRIFLAGLYAKARAGMIKGFTGIDQPYEGPENPEVVCKTVDRSVEECVNQIVQVLEQHGILTPDSTKVLKPERTLKKVS